MHAQTPKIRLLCEYDILNESKLQKRIKIFGKNPTASHITRTFEKFHNL